jgi:tol-pal system protein YbgF
MTHVAVILLAESASSADIWSSVPAYELDITSGSTTNIEVEPVVNPSIGLINTQLFDVLEQLHNEVRQLTGKVELLEHELSRLKKDEKNRYFDLDRRIINLSQPQYTTVKNNIESRADTKVLVNPQPRALTISPGFNALAANSLTRKTDTEAEKSAYKAAFGLIKVRKYEQAKLALKTLINDFPSGIYTANSYYWLGEVFLVQAEYVQALEAFGQVTTSFSNHRKVPDALYKTGVAYDKMGQKDKARAYFQQVISNYPASPSARLALNLLD